MTLSPASSPNDICQALRAAIEAAMPGAEVTVAANSPGHYQVRVVSEVFAGKSLVQQQQAVYVAIAPLMKGDAPPVHAIDRLQTVVR